jgi:hypothetical protein
MNDFKNQKFEKVVVHFDGYHYEKCEFKQCQLIYSGMAPLDLRDCTITDCAWMLAGPAQNTLNFLSGLYSSNPAGKALVETIFQQIRGGAGQSIQQAVPMPKGKVN